MIALQLTFSGAIEAAHVPGVRCPGLAVPPRRALRGQLGRPPPHLPAAAAAPAAELRPHEVIPRPGPDRHTPRQPRGERDLSRLRATAPGNCTR